MMLTLEKFTETFHCKAAICNLQWLHPRCYMDEQKMYKVTSVPFQSSSRRVSFFKDSSALLNILEVKPIKVKSF